MKQVIDAESFPFVCECLWRLVLPAFIMDVDRRIFVRDIKEYENNAKKYENKIKDKDKKIKQLEDALMAKDTYNQELIVDMDVLRKRTCLTIIIKNTGVADQHRLI